MSSRLVTACGRRLQLLCLDEQFPSSLMFWRTRNELRLPFCVGSVHEVGCYLDGFRLLTLAIERDGSCPIMFTTAARGAVTLCAS